MGDANEDGSLSTKELVQGLLKLRGGLEKSDIVAGLMMSRDMQKSIKNIEAMFIRGQGATGTTMLQTRSFKPAVREDHHLPVESSSTFGDAAQFVRTEQIEST